MISRSERRRLHAINRSRLPDQLERVPRSDWPTYPSGDPPLDVWLSREYLVQVFEEPSGIRLSVNRPRLLGNGRWADGLTWDELQEIKQTLGYGDCYGIEIYPPARDVVNVANMRHIWILREPLDVGWKAESGSDAEPVID